MSIGFGITDGSSPRERGKLRGVDEATFDKRLIPA